MLYNILKKEHPGRTLVFCNRRDVSKRVVDHLQARGINCALLSGSVDQKVRLKTLDGFRSGAVQVLIATDVAGRGIHVDNIDLVVNYDIPYEPEGYVHRIGRTGRAGRAGKAYMFACEEEAFSLPEIEELLGQPLSYEHPDKALLEPVPRASVRSSGDTERSGDQRGRGSRDRRSDEGGQI